METIYKLQPHRTMHLQGFDGYGCTAALHHASDSGFTVSGVWGEQDDFAVLVLWDTDNQFEHPRMRYLPDGSFAGISLAFDMTVSNCAPIDSDFYPWVDFASLNVLYKNGTQEQHRLAAFPPDTSAYTPATVTFTLGGTLTPGDYVELSWFDKHYNTQITSSDTFDSVVGRLAYVINSATDNTYDIFATFAGASITLTCYGEMFSYVALGANANRVGAYGMSSNARTETWSPVSANFSGGLSPSTHHVAFDFSSSAFHYGYSEIQKMWLTFAPPVQGGGAFVPNQFSVAVTNWTVTDTLGNRALKVAGPGSVRIEESNPWVKRTGYWEDAPADGFAFWSGGRAIRSAYSAYETRTLTIETHCDSTHDIYVGTRLDHNCGIVSAMLDGVEGPATVDGFGGGVQVRRRLFSDVAPGAHTVVITFTGEKNSSPYCDGWYFYFDFLECAVRSDVPDAPEVRTDVGLATDYDTDATYKLSPQRLLWNVQKLGLTGELDHYMGVFWWPERKMLTPASSWAERATVTFSGSPVWGHHTYLILGGTTLDHMNLIGDTAATVAIAFAQLINQGSTVFWAEVSGAVLTLHGLAGRAANYHLAVSVSITDAGFSASVSTVNGSPVPVDWGVDDSAVFPINTAVQAWHADFFAALHAAGLSATVSFSQELVGPPAAWVQKFADGTIVQTATGFGTLSSSQCTFSSTVRAYMAAAYKQMAGLMETAGLTARLQFGEVGWWFNAGGTPASMAYYDADTSAAAFTTLGGRALASFASSADDPAVNSYADANFLRGRLRDYVAGIRSTVLAAHSAALFEVLWPLDVNDPDRKRLNRYVNLPTEWQARSGSGFDTFICEGLEYAGVRHNIDEARRCAAYPFAELGWDKTHCRYMIGLYYSGWPWQREYLAARRTGVPLMKTWAYDHICMFGWPLPLPRERGRVATF